jgi:hypothetical protein
MTVHAVLSGGAVRSEGWWCLGLVATPVGVRTKAATMNPSDGAPGA